MSHSNVKCSKCGHVERPQWAQPFVSDPKRWAQLKDKLWELRAQLRTEQQRVMPARQARSR